MPRPVLTTALLALLAAVVGGLGAYAWSRGEDGAPAPRSVGATVDPSAAVATDLPGLVAPTGDPQLPGIDAARPAPGSVVSVPGPFDDRFTLSDLQVSHGVVSGRLRVTSDVSELLELEVLAGFYDERGAFLGSGRAVFHLDEEHAHTGEGAGPGTGAPEELTTFRVRAPAPVAGDVAAAAVGVPVLVNE